MIADETPPDDGHDHHLDHGLHDGLDEAPRMQPWNLALRFLLELAALAGIGFGVAGVIGGWLRWLVAVGAVIGAATIWGTFNVPGDPSRSGRAPVVVSGRTRLIVELGVLATGFIGFAAAGLVGISAPMVLLTGLHYATTEPRVRWLLER